MIEEAIQMINEGKSQREVAADLGLSESTLRSKIKKAGFVRNEQAQYILDVTKVESNKVEPPENHEKKEGPTFINDWMTKGTNEGMPKKKKRASFDIDAELLKQLKIFAIVHDKNIYEVAESAIRKYLRE